MDIGNSEPESVDFGCFWFGCYTLMWYRTVSFVPAALYREKQINRIIRRQDDGDSPKVQPTMATPCIGVRDGK